MATGETFRGLDQIKQLTMRSVAARTHGAGLGIKPTNIFTNAEGTKLCWEYMHTAVVTDKWPSSTHRPAPGTKIALPIVLICETCGGKLVKVRLLVAGFAVFGEGRTARGARLQRKSMSMM